MAARLDRTALHCWSVPAGHGVRAGELRTHLESGRVALPDPRAGSGVWRRHPPIHVLTTEQQSHPPATAVRKRERDRALQCAGLERTWAGLPLEQHTKVAPALWV